ncbi:MAG: radical SAM protein [Spirochaetaceae bacterium]|nr:MAG: radical SAM protein [Spirochaetaceae bacterium]
MNCWEYYTRTLSTILWHGDARIAPIRERVERIIAERNLGIDSRDHPGNGAVPPEYENPRTVVVRTGERLDFGRCPGTHGHRCCNYLTLNVYTGCTLGCTYCIMQSYLRNRTLEVRVPGPEQIERILGVARENGGRTVRVGTGEVGDSLLYDPLFGLSEDLVRVLGGAENVQFELKTKTDYVDHLPRVARDAGGAPTGGAPTGGAPVLGFSLNPPKLIREEEGWAASLEERIAAARRGVEMGYIPAFHFDPLILHEGWRDAYGAVVERLAEFRDAPPAWISLGTLRYPPTLRGSIEERPYVLEEFVPSADGKMRYLQPVRSGMYRFMRDRLREALPSAPVYLCMESSVIWRDFMKGQDGKGEGSAASRLRPIMTPLSLAERAGVGYER